jgi:hypothetical protein
VSRIRVETLDESVLLLGFGNNVNGIAVRLRAWPHAVAASSRYVPLRARRWFEYRHARRISTDAMGSRIDRFLQFFFEGL